MPTRRSLSPFFRIHRVFHMVLFALVTSGCAVHPMPDDVTVPLKTEEIILHARCEARDAVMYYLRDKEGFPDDVAIVSAVKRLDKRVAAINKRINARPGTIDISKELTKEENKLLRLVEIAVAYDFDFNITESNNLDGSVGLKLPFTTPASLDLSGSGSLHLTRQGQRQFKVNENLGSLIKRDKCEALYVRDRNAIYPISGRIGLSNLVATFIDISNQGGAKDSFVETLVFTTEANIGVSAGLKLNPVQNHLKLISASAAAGSGRKDVHKLVISLAFPHERGSDAIVGVDFVDGYLNAPFNRPPLWRARYNICVADARAREDKFNALRHEAPEVYCIEYADAFAPSPEAADNKVRKQFSLPTAGSRPGFVSSAPSSRSLYYGIRPDKLNR